MKAALAYAAGLLTIVAAAADWNWFFESRKAEFFVKAFGRQGARAFYAVLGCLIIALGFFACR